MTTAPFEDLLIGAPEGGAALVTINRPNARNALRTQALAEIAEVLAAAAHDSRIGAIVITGRDHPPLVNLLGAIALAASMTNIVSGFLITDRMLKMFKRPGEEKRS